jgi:tRNA (guanine37-N1)-methyltransferase
MIPELPPPVKNPELAAAVIVDAAARFVPGVVGKAGSVRNDSFSGGILDYPQYTRPREFRGLKVPAVLFSGDHKRIERWRRKKALEKTVRQRPDLVKNSTPEDRELLAEPLKERKDE